MLAVGSCGEEERPQEFLDQQAMAAYLIDFHLAEAAITNVRVERDSSNLLFSLVEDDLLEKHQITQAAFIDSYNYYLQHPEELELLYTVVVDSLSLRQSLSK